MQLPKIYCLLAECMVLLGSIERSEVADLLDRILCKERRLRMASPAYKGQRTTGSGDKRDSFRYVDEEEGGVEEEEKKEVRRKRINTLNQEHCMKLNCGVDSDHLKMISQVMWSITKPIFTQSDLYKSMFPMRFFTQTLMRIPCEKIEESDEFHPF